MAVGFVLFWIVLALVIFFVAMRGGARGTRRVAQARAESPGGRRAVVLAVGVVMAFGVAVPAIVLAFNGDHKSSVASGGVVLNRSEQHGRALFAAACATCHTLKAARAVGRVGPNLDQLIPLDGGPQAKPLILDAIAKGRARGNGQMPAGLYQGKDARDVANFVVAVAGH